MQSKEHNNIWETAITKENISNSILSRFTSEYEGNKPDT